MATRCECGCRAKMFSSTITRQGRKRLGDERFFRCLTCGKTWPAPPKKPKKTAAEWRAEVANLERALLNGAVYLEGLHANLMRNSADMLLDPCEAPDVVAQRLRDAAGLGVTPCAT